MPVRKTGPNKALSQRLVPISRPKLSPDRRGAATLAARVCGTPPRQTQRRRNESRANSSLLVGGVWGDLAELVDLITREIKRLPFLLALRARERASR